MARILSIDYGKKRTGLAVTDPLQIIAGGLATVSTCQLFDFLKDYLRVKAFVQKFNKLYPNIPVTFFDERFTSVLAHQAMIDGGLRKKARQNKALVDEISATIILQGFLESRIHNK